MVLNDLEKAIEMVIVGVSQEPRIDARLLLSRDPFKIIYKIAGILSVTAVNGNYLAVCGSDDVALHLNRGLCLKIVDCVFHDRFPFRVHFLIQCGTGSNNVFLSLANSLRFI
jgi:hypothetical protein